VTEEHDHTLPVLYDSDEGWEFQSGVPDGVEDGWFHQELGEVGRVPPDEGEANSGGRVTVWAIDGQPTISYDGDGSLSATGARVLLRLLPKAIKVAEAYRPPAWMLDPAQLHQHKVDAWAWVVEMAEQACPVCRNDE
jgi:hypothetical protein